MKKFFLNNSQRIKIFAYPFIFTVLKEFREAIFSRAQSKNSNFFYLSFSGLECNQMLALGKSARECDSNFIFYRISWMETTSTGSAC